MARHSGSGCRLFWLTVDARGCSRISEEGKRRKEVRKRKREEKSHEMVNDARARDVTGKNEGKTRRRGGRGRKREGG